MVKLVLQIRITTLLSSAGTYPVSPGFSVLSSSRYCGPSVLSILSDYLWNNRWGLSLSRALGLIYRKCLKSPVVGNHSFLSCLQVSAAALLKKYHSMRAEEQGWRSGESARLPPLSPGFHSRKLVSHVGWFSSLLREFYSGSSGFSSSTKTNILSSNLTWKGGKEEPPSVMLTAKSYLCYDVS